MVMAVAKCIEFCFVLSIIIFRRLVRFASLDNIILFLSTKSAWPFHVVHLVMKDTSYLIARFDQNVSLKSIYMLSHSGGLDPFDP